MKNLGLSVVSASFCVAIFLKKIRRGIKKVAYWFRGRSLEAYFLIYRILVIIYLR